jgi:hypothetical protein
MSDNLPVVLHHEVELGDEVGVRTVLVEHKVLGASRAVDVPECFAREVLHLAPVLGLFQADGHTVAIGATKKQTFSEKGKEKVRQMKKRCGSFFALAKDFYFCGQK